MQQANLYLAVISAIKDNSGTITHFIPVDVKKGNVRHEQFHTAQGLHDLGEELQKNTPSGRRVAAFQLIAEKDDMVTPVTGRIFYDAGVIDAKFKSPSLPVYDKDDKMKYGEIPANEGLVIATRVGDLFHHYASDIVVYDFGASGNSMNGQRYFCMGQPASRQNVGAPELFHAERLAHGKWPEFA